MKSTDLIPLRTTVTAVAENGKTRQVPETRTVAEQIEQHRHKGEHDAADRLESACEDTHLDVGRYPDIDPTDPKGSMDKAPLTKKRPHRSGGKKTKTDTTTTPAA